MELPILTHLLIPCKSPWLLLLTLHTYILLENWEIPGGTFSFKIVWYICNYY